MLNKLRKFLASLTALALFMGIAAPMISIAASTDPTASLTVELSPTKGSFKLYDVTNSKFYDNGTVYTSQFNSFQLNAGDYKVVYSSLPNYTLPKNDNQVFTLKAGDTKKVDGFYNQISGNTASLTVELSPVKGTFRIFEVTKNQYYDSGKIYTGQFNSFQLPVGDYKVEFGDLTNYNKPVDHNKVFSLAANETKVIKGYYQSTSGQATLNVELSPTSGTFTLFDVTNNKPYDNTTYTGQFNHFSLTPGDYKLTFGDLTGYSKPVNHGQVFSLSANENKFIQGFYQPDGTVTYGSVALVQGANKDGNFATLTVKGPAGFTDKTSIDGALYTYPQSPAGDYSLEITNIPAGYKAVVKNAKGVVLANAPYTQTLDPANNVTNIAYVVSYIEDNTSGQKGIVNLVQTPNVDGNFAEVILKDANGNNVHVSTDGTPFSKTDANTGDYTLEITNVPAGFKAVVKDANGNILPNAPYTQSLANGSTIEYSVTYEDTTNVGRGLINVKQGPVNAFIEVSGNTSADITMSDHTYTADTGDYTISISKIPAGYEIDTITDINGNALNTPYTQTLIKGGMITYNVTYKLSDPKNMVIVNQGPVNALVQVTGVTTTDVTTKHTAFKSTPGDHTLAIKNIPFGYEIESVKNANGNDLTDPYTQILIKDKSITYNVAYKLKDDFGIIEVEQFGAVGELEIKGSKGGVISVPDTNAKFSTPAVTDDYLLSIVNTPAGFELDKITFIDQQGLELSLNTPYKQDLSPQDTVRYRVYFKAITDGGEIEVNQVNGLGIIQLSGPTAKRVTTASETIKPAGIGIYTLSAIQAPAGKKVAKVEINGTAANDPYAQELKTGEKITYTVTYEDLPAATEIIEIKQVNGVGTMILEEIGSNTKTTVNTATFSQSLVVGNYTLTVTQAPAGKVVKSIQLNGVDITTDAHLLARELKAGSPLRYDVEYADLGDTGTIKVDQTGATGTIQLVGPSPATITTASYTNVNAGVSGGAFPYTLKISAPSGFQVKEVQINGTAANAPYSKELNKGETITYTVIYEATGGNTEVIEVKQTGGVGILKLNGPTPATIDAGNTPYRKDSALGDYTLRVDTLPANTVLKSVKLNGVDITADSATNPRTLVKGTPMVFEVEYEPVGKTGTVEVEQNQAGTIVLTGPTPALVTTTTKYSATSGIGDYNIVVTAPNGFRVKTVEVNGVAKADADKPYTTALAENQTLNFKVTYEPTGGNPTDIDLEIESITTTDKLTPGATITYSVRYKNNTTNDAPGASMVIDYHSNGNNQGSIVVPPANCTDDAANSKLTCTLGTVGAGVDRTFTFAYQLANSVTSGAEITQTATITTTATDLNPNNNSKTAKHVVNGDFSVSKTVDKTVVGDNEELTYTIKIKNNRTGGSPLTLEVKDTFSGSLNSASGQYEIVGPSNRGVITYTMNSGTCGPSLCTVNGNTTQARSNINEGSITIVLNPQQEQTITYKARTSNVNIPEGLTSTVNNEVTVTDVNTQNTLKSLASVSISGPTPNNPNPPNGGGGGGGGGGGVRVFTGDMELNIEKLVSINGTNYQSIDQVAIPENRTSPLYFKLKVTNLGKVSVRDVTFEPFFEKGKSDMTSGDITDLSGATWNKTNDKFEIDKIISKGTHEVTYKRSIRENGQNSNPAIDGLELTAFRANVISSLDGHNYLGIGDQFKTEIYAGSIPGGNNNGNGNENNAKTLSMKVTASNATAKPGDVVTFTLTATNVTDQELTGLIINHEFDQSVLDFDSATDGDFDGKTVTWKRDSIQSGQTITLPFKLKVKSNANEGVAEAMTRALVNEFPGIAPVRNTLSIVKPAGGNGDSQQIELAATGPAMTLLYMMLITIIGYFGYGKVEEMIYTRRKAFALKEM